MKNIPTICRYCGGKVTLTDARTVYGDAVHRLGLAGEKIYLCQNCNARVGCHRGTLRPLGNVANEVLRLKRMETHNVFKKYRKTEADAAEICKRAGLYSPIYAFAPRNGCFFCPNAKRRELRHLYDHHPDLWSRLLECQQAPNKATELFNRNERFDEIDSRFQWEDAQLSLFDGVAYPGAA